MTTPARTATSASSPGRASGADVVAVWAGLLAASALAWTLIVRSSIEMGNGPGTMGRDLGGFLAVWTTMMAAMMLPSVAPVGSVYLRAISSRSAGSRRALRVASLAAGYLAVWASVGVLGYFAAWAAGRLATAAPGVAPWVAAAILAAAGVYQLTRLKDRCLSHCRSPLGFLLHVGNYRGRLRDLRVGLYHGGYCVGCCIGLMAVFIAVGTMNLAWMAGLAAVIFVEKTWRHGQALGVAFGLALVAYGLLVPWFPELAPGLHLDGGREPAMPMEG